MATELGGWTVRRRLGRGGMGTVYHCVNTLVPSIEAAVKTMDPALSRSQRSRARFVREAEVLFGLDHPHIVAVRNVEMDHEPPFLEMAFVEGSNLGSLLSDGQLTRGAAVSLAAQLCSALQHMQDRGVYHRDIKPDNIILSGESATLVDFGLVTEDSRATISRPGSLFGTLQYVPPEWGAMSRPDPGAWDRYSLGVVICEAFTGRPTFVAPTTGTFMEQLQAVQNEKAARAFLDPGPEAPAVVREVVRALTALRPEERRCDLREAADTLLALRQQLEDAEAARLVVETGSKPEAGASSDTWSLPLTGTGSEEVAPDRLLPTGATAVPHPSAPTVEDHPTASIPEPVGPLRPPTASTPMPDEPPVTRWRPAVAVAALGLGLLVGLWAWQRSGPVAPDAPPQTRFPLEVLQTPAELALPVSLFLNDEPFDRSRPPLVAPGNHTLRAVIGRDCEGSPVPPHCHEVVDEVVVDAFGTGARRRLVLPTVPSRAAVFSGEASAFIRVRLPDGSWTGSAERVSLPERLPGRGEVVVQAGDCPDEPCGTDCPSTCAETTFPFALPFEDGGPVELAVAIRAPVVKPKSSGLPPLVSVGRFARWLGDHPEYAPGGAATGGLSKRYLRSWSGRTPPATLANGATVSSGTPVEAVAAQVAEQVCGGQGGLRRVDARPQRWTVDDGGPTPVWELRAGPSGPVLLQFDGAQLPVSVTDARPMVGFRCQQ